MPDSHDLREWLLRRWGYLERRDHAREAAAHAEEALRAAVEQGAEVDQVTADVEVSSAINHVARDVVDALGGKQDD